jgi:hypothetical protein
MDDYAAIVDRPTSNTPDYRLLQGLGTKPYWVTNSDGGDYCFISWSGDDAVSALSYAGRTQVARIAVGDHPQRVRNGWVRSAWVNAQP